MAGASLFPVQLVEGEPYSTMILLLARVLTPLTIICQDGLM